MLGITKMFFTKGDPALMLKYRTDPKLENHDRLRKEVEEVRQVFRVDVERAGLKAAITSVEETPKRMLIVSTSKGYNFLVKKSDAGTWEFVDDRVAAKQAG